MIINRVYRCARLRGRLGATCLALVVLFGLDHSFSYATFFNLSSFFGSSTPSVDIRVKRTSGPITVDDEYLGIRNGLRTLEIKEKLRRPASGTDVNLMSDVEVEICIKPGKGSKLGNIFGDIENILDNIFGILNHKKSSQSSSSYNSGNSGDEWENGIDIGIKKYVKNKTDTLFSNYRMVLGTGVGDNFVASTSDDGLYFLGSPTPQETTNYFQDPPGSQEPYSDFLQWTADGESAPGLGYHQQAAFKFGVHVPRDLFEASHSRCCRCCCRCCCCDGLVARFTIRQYAEVPEPSVLALLSLGMITVSIRPRRRRRRDG